MSNEQDIATIIKYTREIETILKSKFKAEGTGLHSQLNSIESKLPDPLIKQIRYLASVRNDAMHNHSAKVGIKSFEKAAKKSIEELKKIKKPSLPFLGMRANEESSNNKRRRNSNKHNANKRKRTFSIPFKRIILLIILGGIFYDYQYNASKQINRITQISKELLKELDKNTQKDRNKIANSLEVKATDSAKKEIDSNVIIMENNKIYTSD